MLFAGFFLNLLCNLPSVYMRKPIIRGNIAVMPAGSHYANYHHRQSTIMQELTIIENSQVHAISREKILFAKNANLCEKLRGSIAFVELCYECEFSKFFQTSDTVLFITFGV